MSTAHHDFSRFLMTPFLIIGIILSPVILLIAVSLSWAMWIQRDIDDMQSLLSSYHGHVYFDGEALFLAGDEPLNLEVHDRRFGDADLVSLSKKKAFARITSVDLSGTGVSDRAIEFIQGFPKIFRINASQTAVTGAGFTSALKNPSIQAFTATGLAISDNDLRNACDGPARQGALSVHIEDTPVSEQAVKALVKCLQCTVAYGPSRNRRYIYPSYDDLYPRPGGPSTK